MQLLTTQTAPTVLNFQMVQVCVGGCCTAEFESEYPIELRGIMEQTEFKAMMDEFNRVYRTASPNMGCFVMSSVFCICTLGTCMFYQIYQMFKAQEALRRAIKAKSDALAPRGFQLIMRASGSDNGGIFIEMHVPRVISQTVVPVMGTLAPAPQLALQQAAALMQQQQQQQQMAAQQMAMQQQQQQMLVGPPSAQMQPQVAMNVSSPQFHEAAPTLPPAVYASPQVQLQVQVAPGMSVDTKLAL